MKTEPEYPTASEDEAEMNRREAEQREADLAHLEESADEDDEESPETRAERLAAYGDWLRDDRRDRDFDGRNSPGFYPEAEDAERLADRADMLRDERRDA